MALWRSTVIVSANDHAFSGLGFGTRHCSYAKCLWLGKDFDTFVVAFRIPNFFRRLFAEGAFSLAFIPVLTEYKTGRTHAEVQILISRVFGLFNDGYDGFNLHCYGRSSSSAIHLCTGFPCRSREVRPRGFNVPPHHSLFIVYVADRVAFASSILNSYGSFVSPAFSPVLG